MILDRMLRAAQPADILPALEILVKRLMAHRKCSANQKEDGTITIRSNRAKTEITNIKMIQEDMKLQGIPMKREEEGHPLTKYVKKVGTMKTGGGEMTDEVASYVSL